MIASLAVFLFGITFVEQDLEDLRVGGLNPLTGKVSTEFRQSDLDGDGVTDLILPNDVVFQRGGGFRRENRHPLPDSTETAQCDVWGRDLYLRYSQRLLILRWENDQWRRVLEQRMRWPDGLPARSTAEGSTDRVTFARFLHDIDGDGTPEILVAAPDGLHIYALAKELYSEVNRLDVFPALHLTQSRHQALWPPERRRIALPEREMACQFFLERNNLTVIVREDLDDGRVRYPVVRYVLDSVAPFAVEPEKTALLPGEPLPNSMDPCRLTDGDRIDYGGGDWQLAMASVLPAPIYETLASTDGGKTVQSARSESFHSHCSFVDVNGDGRLDMITEQMTLFEGGLRETVARFLTSSAVEHETHVHFQDATGHFSTEPDLRARFTIRLGEPPVRGGSIFRRYQAGELVNVTGDFDGDGKRDALVQIAPNRLAVFLNTGQGFDTQPAGTLDIPEGASFSVVDVDGDRRSDIVLSWVTGGDSDSILKGATYLTRESAP